MDVIVRAGLVSQVELAVRDQAAVVLALREQLIYLTSATVGTETSSERGGLLGVAEVN